MAVSDTTEGTKLNLKHRLLGAGVLVTVAVIILPMLLSGEDTGKYTITFLPNTVKTDDESFVSQVKSRDEAADAANQPDASASTQSNNTQKTVALDADATGDGSCWIVQMGVFKKAANTNQIMQILRDKGFQPQSAEVNTDAGRATRVWVGPYSKRYASRMLNRLEGEIDEKGFISACP